MLKYTYSCPICKTPKGFLSVSSPPFCEGPEHTHYKEMEFLPDKSVGTPPYLAAKKTKKA